MPILNDIMDHKVFGPAIRQGREEGKLEGKQKLVHLILQKRFGTIPRRIEERVANMSLVELDDLGIRVLDASHLEQLFPTKS